MTDQPLTEADKAQLRQYNWIIVVSILAIVLSLATMAFSIGVSATTHHHQSTEQTAPEPRKKAA